MLVCSGFERGVFRIMGSVTSLMACYRLLSPAVILLCPVGLMFSQGVRASLIPCRIRGCCSHCLGFFSYAIIWMHVVSLWVLGGGRDQPEQQTNARKG